MISMLNGFNIALTNLMFCGSSSTIRIEEGVFLPRLPSARRSNLRCEDDWDVLGFGLAPEIVDQAAASVGRKLGVDQHRQRLQLHGFSQRFLGAGGDYDLVAGMAQEGLDPLLYGGIVVGHQDHGRLGAGTDRRQHLHRALLDAGLLLGELDQFADVLDEAFATLVDMRHELPPFFGGCLVSLLVEQDLGEPDDGVEGRVEIVALVVDNPELGLEIPLRL
jgi:hypothetical protein